MHAREGFPVLPAVVGAEQISGLLVSDAPCGNEHLLWVLGIDSNVVEHIVVGS